MIQGHDKAPGANPEFKGMVLRFRKRTVPDEAATRIQGRPVTREAEWVRVHAAGDKGNMQDREVGDRERAHPAYAAWKEGRPFGTPLSAWERTAGEDMIEALANAGIYSLEDLAGVSDAHVRGDFSLRQGARDFLAARKVEADAKQTDARDRELADLKAQVAALTAALQGKDDR